jgi:hypothetical protein
MADSPAKPAKPAKKEKPKRQTEAERQAMLAYHRTMYGPTSGEHRAVVKKVDWGAPYLQHPKFLGLVEAFRHGRTFEFSVTDKGRAYGVSTDGGLLRFSDAVIFYSRPLNKYESSLLMDRAAALRFQEIESFAHLVFAILRSFPELGPIRLRMSNRELWWDTERLEAGIAAQGPNLLVGDFRHAAPKEKKG